MSIFASDYPAEAGGAAPPIARVSLENPKEEAHASRVDNDVQSRYLAIDNGGLVDGSAHARAAAGRSGGDDRSSNMEEDGSSRGDDDDYYNYYGVLHAADAVAEAPSQQLFTHPWHAAAATTATCTASKKNARKWTTPLPPSTNTVGAPPPHGVRMAVDDNVSTQANNYHSRAAKPPAAHAGAASTVPWWPVLRPSMARRPTAAAAAAALASESSSLHANANARPRSLNITRTTPSISVVDDPAAASRSSSGSSSSSQKRNIAPVSTEHACVIGPRHEQEGQRVGPAWIAAFVGCHAYFSKCQVHVQQQQAAQEESSANACWGSTTVVEKNQFCIDCVGGPICPRGMKKDHNGHRMLQVRRASKSNSIKALDIQEHLDISGIQQYTINNAKIVFLCKRPSSSTINTVTPPYSYLHAHSSGSSMPSSSSKATADPLKVYCLACGRTLPDAMKFCSLQCKLESIERNLDTFSSLSLHIHPPPPSSSCAASPNPKPISCSLASLDEMHPPATALFPLRKRRPPPPPNSPAARIRPTSTAACGVVVSNGSRSSAAAPPAAAAQKLPSSRGIALAGSNMYSNSITKDEVQQRMSTSSSALVDMKTSGGGAVGAWTSTKEEEAVVSVDDIARHNMIMVNQRRGRPILPNSNHGFLQQHGKFTSRAAAARTYTYTTSRDEGEDDDDDDDANHLVVVVVAAPGVNHNNNNNNNNNNVAPLSAPKANNNNNYKRKGLPRRSPFQ